MDFYAIQRPVGKINDIPELRYALIQIFDTKTKQELARFGLTLGAHLMDVTGFAAGDCDDAIALTNRLYPGDLAAARQERLAQIALMDCKNLS